MLLKIPLWAAGSLYFRPELGGIGLGDLQDISQHPHSVMCARDAFGFPLALGCKQRGEGW